MKKNIFILFMLAINVLHRQKKDFKVHYKKIYLQILSLNPFLCDEMWYLYFNACVYFRKTSRMSFHLLRLNKYEKESTFQSLICKTIWCNCVIFKF